MNPQPEQDLEYRFQKLEAEAQQTPPPYPILQPKRPIQQLLSFTTWFSKLSSLGKLVVVSVVALASFAVLQAVLKLVAAAISLAILAVLMYLIYQFFLARSSETKD